MRRLALILLLFAVSSVSFAQGRFCVRFYGDRFSCSNNFVPAFYNVGVPCAGNQTFSIEASNIRSGMPAILFLSTGKADLNFGGLNVYVDLANSVSLFGLSTGGSNYPLGLVNFSLPIPNQPVIVGAQIYSQMFLIEGSKTFSTTGLDFQFRSSSSLSLLKPLSSIEEYKKYFSGSLTKSQAINAAVNLLYVIRNHLLGWIAFKGEVQKVSFGGKSWWVPQYYIPLSIGINPKLMKMSFIPGGVFVQGDDTNWTSNLCHKYMIPAHKVAIRPFVISTCEVTQDEWITIAGSTPWKGSSGFVKEGPNFPAVNIGQRDLTIFFGKLSKLFSRGVFRLPSESEFEYVCRGGTNTRFFFGNDPKLLSNYGWFAKECFQKKELWFHEVGKKLPNPLGVYDILGNAFETVSDYSYKDYSCAPTDGRCWKPGTPSTVRGGGLTGSPILREEYFGSAFRCGNFVSSSLMGFRIVIPFK